MSPQMLLSGTHELQNPVSEWLRKKNQNVGSGAKTQQLRTLAAFARRPGFSSRHSHSGTQPPVTPLQRDLRPSSDFLWHLYPHGAHKQVHTQNIS